MRAASGRRDDAPEQGFCSTSASGGRKACGGWPSGSYTAPPVTVVSKKADSGQTYPARVQYTVHAAAVPLRRRKGREGRGIGEEAVKDRGLAETYGSASCSKRGQPSRGLLLHVNLR